MIRRAKISVLFTLVGALTASGALLNPEQRHTVFQPGRNASPGMPAVLKPAQATIANRIWQGTKVQRITPITPTAVKVELSGITLSRAGDATLAPAAVRQAGGGR